MSDPTTTPTPATPPPASPFAAQATSAPAASEAAVDYGDTSFLDNISSREPLVRNCFVQGTVSSIEARKNDEGKQRISLTVQLWGDNMLFDDGTPVSPGKRLSTTIYLPIDTDEKRARSERKLRNLLLALYDIPLNGSESAAYAALTPDKKIGWLAPNDEKGRTAPEFSLHVFSPPDKWAGTKVIVQVTLGKDMDGNPRNEFVLHAASTPPRKSKS